MDVEHLHHPGDDIQCKHIDEREHVGPNGLLSPLLHFSGERARVAPDTNLTGYPVSGRISGIRSDIRQKYLAGYPAKK